MPVIKVNDKQFPLLRARIVLAREAMWTCWWRPMIHWGFRRSSTSRTTHRPSFAAPRNGASVRVNGIALVDPTPLMHGDKVEIAGSELLFSDDSKSGNTRVRLGGRHGVARSEAAGSRARDDRDRRTSGLARGWQGIHHSLCAGSRSAGMRVRTSSSRKTKSRADTPRSRRTNRLRGASTSARTASS